MPDEARPRGLAETYAELHAGHRCDHGLVQVLEGLNEVGLADDHVGIGWLDDFDRAEFHTFAFSAIRCWLTMIGPLLACDDCPMIGEPRHSLRGVQVRSIRE